MATTTYRIEATFETEANPHSQRSGLWTSELGESSGWGLRAAKKAAKGLAKEGGFGSNQGIKGVRVVNEKTGEVVDWYWHDSDSE